VTSFLYVDLSYKCCNADEVLLISCNSDRLAVVSAGVDSTRGHTFPKCLQKLKKINRKRIIMPEHLIYKILVYGGITSSTGHLVNTIS